MENSCTPKLPPLFLAAPSPFPSGSGEKLFAVSFAAVSDFDNDNQQNVIPDFV